jgi:hypothetical protein
MAASTEFVLDLDFLTNLERRLAVPDEVAIVGAGRWAKVMCDVLSALFAPRPPALSWWRNGTTRPRSIGCDDRLRAVPPNGTAGVRPPSLHDVLESDRTEVAIVTKMASEHYTTTKRLLLAGKHVLVEKPFVLRAAEAEELTGLARTRGLTLAVGYEFCFARALHHLRQVTREHFTDVSAVRFVWEDAKNSVKWGVRKQPDLSANIVTDLYPHILSQLVILFGRQDVVLRGITSRTGVLMQRLEMQYGSRSVTASLDKDAREDRRLILVSSPDGRCLRLDCTTEPGRIDLDGQPLAADGLAETFPRSLTTEIAYYSSLRSQGRRDDTEHR